MKKNIYIFEPPRQLVVKNPPASARDMSSIPESGRSPGERNGRLYSPGESDSTSWLSNNKCSVCIYIQLKVEIDHLEWTLQLPSFPHLDLTILAHRLMSLFSKDRVSLFLSKFSHFPLAAFTYTTDNYTIYLLLWCCFYIISLPWFSNGCLNSCLHSSAPTLNCLFSLPWGHPHFSSPYPVSTPAVALIIKITLIGAFVIIIIMKIQW